MRSRGAIVYGVALSVLLALGALVPEGAQASCCLCAGCTPAPACMPFTNSIDCNSYCQNNGGCNGFEFLNTSCNAGNGQCEANTPTASATATLTATVTATATATPTRTETPIATGTSTATQTGTVTNTPPATPTNTPAPNGGNCTGTSDCVAGNFCVDDVCCSDPACPAGSSCGNPGHVGMCAADPIAPAPALSPRSLLGALVVLIGLGGLATLRRGRS